MRAVLDVNVLISGSLSPAGAPARLLLAWQAGEFELVVSPLLLAELEQALAYPKLRRLIPADDADAFVAWLRRAATIEPDSDRPPPVRSADPADDYLLALAADRDAALVSGDRHLLDVAGALPIHAPSSFLALLAGIAR